MHKKYHNIRSLLILSAIVVLAGSTVIASRLSASVSEDVAIAVLDYAQDGSTLKPGKLYTKRLHVENTGTVMANDVVVNIPVPKELLFNKSQSSPGCNIGQIHNVSSNTWQSGVLCGDTNMDYKPGDEIEYAVSFDVPETIDCAKSVPLEIGVIYEGSSDYKANSFTRILSVVACAVDPKIAVMDYADGGIIKPGKLYSKILLIENVGDVTAHDVVVNIQIPTPLLFNKEESSPDCEAGKLFKKDINSWIDGILCGDESMDYVPNADHHYTVSFDVPEDLTCKMYIPMVIGYTHAESDDFMSDSFIRTLIVQCPQKEEPECNNGIDDNKDGDIDMFDASCDSPSQENEGKIDRCTDSDGGRNLNKKGVTRGYINTGWAAKYEDYCGTIGLVEGKLLEYVCTDRDYVEQEVVTCPNGCKDGVCLEEAPVVVAPPPSPPAGYEDEVEVNVDTYDNPFSDTNTYTLEGKAAAELYRRAVIGGYPDGEFKGERPVNRAEAAKFLLLARFGNVPEGRNDVQFPDVLDGQWYTKFVVYAAAKGIITGYPDGTFRPADTVNTAEFLKMLTLTFGLNTNLSHSYLDVKDSDWFASYAGIAKKYNLFPSRLNNLRPSSEMSRGEVALAIYQYLRQCCSNL